jgi:hypothetical protein
VAPVAPATPCAPAAAMIDQLPPEVLTSFAGSMAVLFVSAT